MQAPIVVDFETEAICDRPDYPPKPVGVAILWPGEEPRYWSWAHPIENNCTREDAVRHLRTVFASDKPLLFQHAAFDLSVANEGLGIPLPSWERVHDTLFLLFLKDPHANSLSLKPSAERYLGMPPEERDAVRDWLVDHSIITKKQDPGPHISKAPGGIVGTYACGDVVRTKLLYEHLLPTLDEGMTKAYNRERRLLPILMRNEREGVFVNVKALRKDIKAYEKALLHADVWLRTRLGVPGLNLDASDELVAALKSTGIVTEFAKTPKSKKDSTSKKTLTPDKFNDPEVARVLGYRNRLETVLANSMRPWLLQAKSTEGRIYTAWNQVRNGGEQAGFQGTRTGRLSCSRFQNITKDFTDKNDGYEHPKTVVLPELPVVRRYITADPDETFVHRDYNQQEFRIIAHFAEGEILEAYQKDARTDFHKLMQTSLATEAGLDLQRRLVKIINFSIKYGTGAKALAALLGFKGQEGVMNAYTIIQGVKRATPSVAALNKALKSRARGDLPIRTWGGRLYFCEAPREVYIDKHDHTKGTRMQSFDYKLLSYLIQGSGADCAKEAIIRYDDAKVHGRFLVSVHDEINLSVPKKYARVEAEILRQAMESIEFDVPMITDAKFGPSWGELESEVVAAA